MTLPLKKDSERSFLPYGKQTITEEDIAAVTSAMRDPFLTCGPKVEAFERALAQKIDAPHAIAVSNGTTALHIAATALDIAPGDQVLVPAITFLSTANVVRFLGGEVIFTDVNPETGLMDWASYQKALSRADPAKLKALFYVHMNGQVGEDFVRIAEDAQKFGLKILEDAAHAIGSSYSDGGNVYKVGACAHSDAVTFSFHPVKTITTGEGGAVSAKDEVLAERMRSLRHHGITRTDTPEKPWAYEMHELGYNYRITDIQCALGISQLKRLDKFTSKRRDLVSAYDKAFANVEHISTLPKAFPELTGWHLYPILIDFENCSITKGGLMNALKERGIGTQVHYIPVNRQPYYKKLGKIHLPGAKAYSKATLSLPLYPDMTLDDVGYVAAELKKLLHAEVS